MVIILDRICFLLPSDCRRLSCVKDRNAFYSPRFAREAKHKIDLFDEKHKKSKEKSDHRLKDNHRIASSGSGDEVAFHLDVDEKREFQETETKVSWK